MHPISSREIAVGCSKLESSWTHICLHAWLLLESIGRYCSPSQSIAPVHWPQLIMLSSESYYDHAIILYDISVRKTGLASSLNQDGNANTTEPPAGRTPPPPLSPPVSCFPRMLTSTVVRLSFALPFPWNTRHPPGRDKAACPALPSVRSSLPASRVASCAAGVPPPASAASHPPPDHGAADRGAYQHPRDRESSSLPARGAPDRGADQHPRDPESSSIPDHGAPDRGSDLHPRDPESSSLPAPDFRGLSAARILHLAERDGSRWRPVDVSAAAGALGALAKGGDLGVPGDASGSALHAVLRLLEGSCGSFDPPELAESLTACKRLNRTHGRELGPAVSSLCARVVSTPGSFSGGEVSLVMKALAGLRRKDEGVMKCMCAEALRLPKGAMDAEAVVDALHALARLKYREEELVARLRAEALMLPKGLMKGKEIAKALNALAKLGECDEKLMKRLCADLTGLPPGGMNAQDVANALNALARLAHRDEEALARLCAEVLRLPAGAMKAQEITNVLNALAKLEYRDEAVVARLCMGVLQLPAGAMNGQGLANALNALAKLEYRDDAVMARLCREVLGLSSGAMNEQGVANALNALAKLEYRDEAVIVRICVEVLGLPPGAMNAHGVANTLNALAKLEHRDHVVVARLCSEALGLYSGTMTAQGVAVGLNALAKLEYRDKAVVNRLCAEGLSLPVGAMKAQYVANSLHALMSLGYVDAVTAMWPLLVRLSAAEMDANPQSLSQLHLVGLSLAVEYPELDLRLPEPIRAAAQRVWDASLASARPSQLHLDVARELRSLGVAHVVETVVGGLSVDIAIEADTVASGSKRTVLEVDGPRHFFRNAGARDVRLGWGVWKHRLLEAQGWRVVSVSYHDWRRARHKAPLLRELLGMERPRPLC